MARSDHRPFDDRCRRCSAADGHGRRSGHAGRRQPRPCARGDGCTDAAPIDVAAVVAERLPRTSQRPKKPRCRSAAATVRARRGPGREKQNAMPATPISAFARHPRRRTGARLPARRRPAARTSTTAGHRAPALPSAVGIATTIGAGRAALRPDGGDRSLAARPPPRRGRVRHGDLPVLVRQPAGRAPASGRGRGASETVSGASHVAHQRAELGVIGRTLLRLDRHRGESIAARKPSL